MPKFRCTVIVPQSSSTYEIEGENLDDALQEFHCENVPHRISSVAFRHEFEPGKNETIFFTVFRVEGEESPLIVRTFYRGISRKGGVKPPPSKQDTLEGLAEILGWKRDPKDLIAPWDGEESWENAEKRKWKG